MRRTITAIAVAALAATMSPAVADTETEPVHETYEHMQWGLDAVDVYGAWDAPGAPRGAGVTVAVIDDGFDIEHPEFTGRVHEDAATWNCGTAPAPCPLDDSPSRHGVHVAGIIAAARDGAGTVGVAPEATVMPLVMPFDGAEAILTVPEMVRYAVDHGADIINGSIGAGPALPGIGPAENGVALAAGWREAFQYAIDRGVLVVMAAGNEWGPTCINELANIGEILCVGSLTRNGQVPLYSNYGVGLDLVAPGGGADPGAFGGSDVQNCLDGVLSAYSEEYSDQPNCADDIFGTPVPPYGFMTGTSQATPHVAGVAALLVGQGLTPLEAGERILATTDDLLVGGWDARTGHGALNAHRAVIDDRNPDSSIVTIG